MQHCVITQQIHLSPGDKDDFLRQFIKLRKRFNWRSSTADTMKRLQKSRNRPQ